MKILIAAGIYPPDPGGPAIHAERQYEWFNSRGIKTTVVALAHYRSLPRGVRHVVYMFALAVKAVDTDIIYAHDALGAGIPALAVARLLGKKLVVRIGGDVAWEREVKESMVPLAQWYESGQYKESPFFKKSLWLMKKADKIIVTSPLLANIYTKYYGIEPEKIVMIANPVPEVPNLQVESSQNIVYASRLVSYKNLDTVLKVLVKVFPHHPELKFVIMGDGHEREHLFQLSENLGITDRVIFKGSVSQDEVLAETAKALFTIAPAVTEFNPNYVLQGIAYGKPFIISRGHGLPFTVPDSMQFQYNDQDELAGRIENLLTKEGYLQAREFVVSLDLKMSWDDNLEANSRALRALLNGSK